MEESNLSEYSDEGCYACTFSDDKYKLSFSRCDDLIQHAVCRLDIEADHVLVADADAGMLLLGTLPWQLSIGLRDEDEFPFILCAASSSMLPPGTPVCGFVIHQVPWDFALHLIDGYRRSGNLMLHIVMRDAQGEEVDVESPIFPAKFYVIDPSGRLSVRLEADYARRN